MKIEFSFHALLKIDILQSQGVAITKESVEGIVKAPYKVDTGYRGRLIAQGRLDDTHVVRVVYEESPERIRIITVYPGRRSRYEND